MKALSHKVNPQLWFVRGVVLLDRVSTVSWNVVATVLFSGEMDYFPFRRVTGYPFQTPLNHAHHPLKPKATFCFQANFLFKRLSNIIVTYLYSLFLQSKRDCYNFNNNTAWNMKPLCNMYVKTNLFSFFASM